MALTGKQVREIRIAQGLSQQELAFRATVNKAYISEYETGVRAALPPEMLERIERTLLATESEAGRVLPRLVNRGGHVRLLLQDRDGNEFLPRVASVKWTEDDGTTYSLFVGDRRDS